MKWSKACKHGNYFIHLDPHAQIEDYYLDMKEIWSRSIATLFERNKHCEWDVVFVEFWYDPGHVVIYPGRQNQTHCTDKARIRATIPALVELEAEHMALIDKIEAGLATEEHEEQLIERLWQTEARLAEMIYRSAVELDIRRRIKDRFGKCMRRIIVHEYQPEREIAEYDMTPHE